VATPALNWDTKIFDRTPLLLVTRSDFKSATLAAGTTYNDVAVFAAGMAAFLRYLLAIYFTSEDIN
jgi:hypothetical protein